MSAPYGQPPAAPQPGPSRPGTSQPQGGGPGIGGILALVAAVLGLAAYFSTFTDDTFSLSQNLLTYFVLGGGLLAAASLLPKAPDALVPAAVLAALGSLGALALLVTLPEGVDSPGALIFVLVLGLLETAALVGAVLVAGGVIKMTPKPAPFGGGQQWGPQSGSFPAQQPGQYPPGQYGQAPPGQYGQPQQGQYPGQGQYGQPQQPPSSGQYGQPTAQWSQGQDFGNWESGSREPGRDYGQPGDFGQPGEYPRPGDDGPGQQGSNPPYGQPGTPPGGAHGPGGGNGPDRS